MIDGRMIAAATAAAAACSSEATSSNRTQQRRTSEDERRLLDRARAIGGGGRAGTMAEAKQLAGLVRQATSLIDRLIDRLDLSDHHCGYLHSDEGRATCELFRRLVLQLSKGTDSESTAVGWNLLPPNTTDSLTRLVLQLAMLNRRRLAAKCAVGRFANGGSSSNENDTTEESSPSDAGATATVVDQHVQLQERLEPLIVHLLRPSFSWIDATVTSLCLLLNVSTVIVAWFALLYHASLGAWPAAVLTWLFMVLPDIVILCKESTTKWSTWWHSRVVLFKLVLPYSISAALIASLAAGWSAMRLTTTRSRMSGSDSEHGIDPRIDELSTDIERYNALRRRFEVDRKVARNYPIRVRFGFLPSLIVQCCVIDGHGLEPASNPQLWLVPAIVAYCLSTVAGYTTFASAKLTCPAAPYVYVVMPRIKLFLGIFVTLVTRTVALVLFLRNTIEIGVVAGVLVLGCCVLNVAFAVWIEGRRFFELERGLGALFSRILLVLLSGGAQMFEPYVVEPDSSLEYTVCVFLLDLVQMVVFVRWSYSSIEQWIVLRHTSLLWLYLIGCVLQWWTFARFTPGQPRGWSDIMMYAEMILRQTQSRSDVEDSSKMADSKSSGERFDEQSVTTRSSTGGIKTTEAPS